MPPRPIFYVMPTSPFTPAGYKKGADRGLKSSLKVRAPELRFNDKPRDKYGRARGKATVTMGYMNKLKRRFYVAIDPRKQNSAVRTLADMTPEERAAIEARYGAKIA
jgi:hypothetical protein